MNWIILVVVVVAVAGVFALKQLSLVPVATAQELLRQGAVVVDVRSPGEFGGGHLPRAINIPLGGLAERLPEVVKDKQQVVLLHCLSGGRSGIAKYQLKRLGYPNAYNLGSYSRAQRIVQAEH